MSYALIRPKVRLAVDATTDATDKAYLRFGKSDKSEKIIVEPPLPESSLVHHLVHPPASPVESSVHRRPRPCDTLLNSEGFRFALTMHGFGDRTRGSGRERGRRQDEEK